MYLLDSLSHVVVTVELSSGCTTLFGAVIVEYHLQHHEINMFEITTLFPTIRLSCFVSSLHLAVRKPVEQRPNTQKSLLKAPWFVVQGGQSHYVHTETVAFEKP